MFGLEGVVTEIAWIYGAGRAQYFTADDSETQTIPGFRLQEMQKNGSVHKKYRNTHVVHGSMPQHHLQRIDACSSHMITL